VLLRGGPDCQAGFSRRAEAVGLFAVAISAVIAVRIVGNVESGKPPTAAPVQVWDVSIANVEGADVQLDVGGIMFLAFDIKRVSHWSHFATSTIGTLRL
jgi:hypothetical protein